MESTYFEKLSSMVFSLLPEEAPDFHYKADYFQRRDQYHSLEIWFEDNKNRLTWKSDKRRYYLNPDTSD